MKANDTQFLAEMYHLVKKMEEVIDEYDVKHRVLASVVIGLFDKEAIDEEEETAEVKTMYSFNLQNKEELDMIKGLMDEMYNPEDNDPLDDLLGDLGISLN
ncbi:MAG: hypothetical protein CMJ25_20155 [Phycisphaerae bacterium]|nr:hypothetical protein [Phycisphaerae bacterium]|tara:strand:- start:707 stop:1009 length:303 start_codon:yes stop_codon:yes gene_type:complete